MSAPGEAKARRARRRAIAGGRRICIAVSSEWAEAA